jgi:stage II sporulation protein D
MKRSFLLLCTVLLVLGCALPCAAYRLACMALVVQGTAPSAAEAASVTSEESSRVAPSPADTADTVCFTDQSTGQTITLPLREYLIGAVAAEMPVSWPDEALKAQAVAAHSYALYRRDHSTEENGAWFTADPVRRQGCLTDAVLHSYWGTAYAANYARLSALVDAVQTQVLYYEDAPAGTSYFAMSNGRTEASEKVWGTALPYLVPVDSSTDTAAGGRKIPLLECLRLRQTWAIVLGKFLTDGVWWFFLFWTPAYISDVYGYASDTFTAQMLIFVLYAITMLSILGGKLPTVFINRTGKNAYTCRMRAMLIFAVFPLLGLLAQPVGQYSCWLTIVIIGIVGAAHQSWSANLFSVGSDLFPKNTVATITGLNGMAGGISSFLINVGSGRLLDYVEQTRFTLLGFEGKEAGYFMIFCGCSVAYLLGWTVMKSLVPRYKPVE